MLSNPYQQYRATAVETARPVDLVVMLYKGVLRFTQQGIQAVERQDVEDAHVNFLRAQQIVTELVSGLNPDRGGDIASQLRAIYDYVHRRLVEANCQKAIGPAAEVVQLFSELLSAWQAIAEGRAAEELEAGQGSLEQMSAVS